MYAVLVILALSSRIPRSLYDKKTWQLASIIALYGIALELLQKFSYLGRTFEFLDIIANISGVLVGIIIFDPLSKILKL